MDYAKLVNDFLAQHHIVGLALAFLMLRKIFRPALVDIRSACVWGLAFIFALGANWGITPEKIEEYKPRAEKAMPEVPADDSSGVLGKILGVSDPKP